MTTVLVIDDEQELLEEIVDILTFEGYDVISACDGRSGVKLAVETLPDLILCDIMMPRMDGYEVIQELRNYKSTATTPFIFLTAKADVSDIRDGMSLGADDYLTKPFHTNELIDSITVRLSKHQTITTETEAHLDAMRQVMVTSLPHELRTPLTSILGAAQIMNLCADDLNEEQILNYTQLILNAGSRLNRLVENYLLYSQLYVVKTGYSPESIAKMAGISFPSTLIHDLISQLCNEENRHEDVTFDLCDNVMVAVSPDHLHKIVAEVVDNAMKFSEEGTKIAVTTSHNNSTFTVSITDQGRGMSPSQIKQIAPFVQFDRDKHEQQGSGLGLVIVKKFVELYGGHFTIQSHVDQGTCVSISFPMDCDVESVA